MWDVVFCAGNACGVGRSLLSPRGMTLCPPHALRPRRKAIKRVHLSSLLDQLPHAAFFLSNSPAFCIYTTAIAMVRKYLGGSGKGLTVWISIAASTTIIFYGYDQVKSPLTSSSPLLNVTPL